MSVRLTVEQAETLAGWVVETARSIWREADCEDDFCVQHYGDSDTIVFGGTNRIVWSVRHGFRAEPSYCTERFLEAFGRWLAP